MTILIIICFLQCIFSVPASELQQQVLIKFEKEVTADLQWRQVSSYQDDQAETLHERKVFGQPYLYYRD